MKGDMKDLTEEVLKKYFKSNDMNQGNLSCCYKHFLASECITANDEPEETCYSNFQDMSVNTVQL